MFVKNSKDKFGRISIIKKRIKIKILFYKNSEQFCYVV